MLRNTPSLISHVVLEFANKEARGNFLHVSASLALGTDSGSYEPVRCNKLFGDGHGYRCSRPALPGADLFRRRL